MQLETSDMQNQKRRNLALVSIILSALGLAPISIICGHMVLSKTKHDSNTYAVSDWRMAIGGLIIGYIGLLLWFYIGLLFAAIIWGWDLSVLFPFGITTIR